MAVKWNRRQFTTPSADPTVVVEWKAYDEHGNLLITLMEFQGIIIVKDINNSLERNLEGQVEWLAAQLHAALEETHEAGITVAEIQRDAAVDADVEAAERRAGWDPKP